VRIPRRLLENAKLRPGDRVDVEEVPGGGLSHDEAPTGLVWEGALLVVDGEPSDELAAEMNRLRKEDLARELRDCRPR
jgi:ferric-dicitrate binding protein FerR (iron transport regulator)